MRRGLSILMAAVVVGSIANALVLTVPATAATTPLFRGESPGKFGRSLIPHPSSAAGPSHSSRPTAPRSAPACTGAWNLVPSPTNGSGDNFLTATTAVSATDIWAAAGDVDAATGLYQMYFEHWDGSMWTVLTTPNIRNGSVETDNTLSAIAAVSSTNVWAVGSFINTGGVWQPLVDHWDGTSWTPTALAPQSSGDNELFGVTAIAANDIWAVGYWSPDNSSPRQTLAWHWNGTSWSPAFPQNNSPGAFSNTLFAVSAAAGNNVFAVGRYYTGADGGNSYPIIERWDGANWSITYPSSVNPYGILFGVSVVSSTLAWAVGFDQSNFGAAVRTMILKWDGTAWTRMPSPNIGGSQHPNNELFAVAGTSATNAWAVGAAFGPFVNGQVASGQTLISHWNGVSWTASPSPDASGYDELVGVAAVSAADVWAVGDAVVGGVDRTLTENLCIAPPSVTGLNPSAGPNTGGNNVTIAGTSFATASAVNFGSNAASSFTVNSDSSITAVAPAGSPGTVDVTVTNAAGTSPPVAADHYTYVLPPTVVSISPTSGPEAGGTSVTITGSNFTNDSSVSFGGLAAASVVVNSTTSITAVSPAHCPGAVDVTVTTPGGTSPTIPADQFTFVGDLCAAVTTRQYSLTGTDGATWRDIDTTGLSIIITPNVDSRAILSANADLWTSSPGYNQDLAITVNGAVAGWKESGGYAGTFSPNAASVQTVVDMTGGQSYVMKLQWKANKPDAGTIWAGAGPIAGKYSPTSLTMMLLATTSTNLSSRVSRQQYQLTNSDGDTWTDIDAANLSLPAFMAPAGGGTAVLSANADLWTARAGYNQDIGISVVDVNALPCTGGCQPVAWKESGGFAGTFSPNAAFVQTAYAMTAGHTYQIKMQWKTNKPDSGTIVAGAGPIAGQYSPTRLTMLFYPTATPANPVDTVSTQQYHLTGSNGSTWADIDAPALSTTVTSWNACLAILSANADLWTSSPGFNQDIGISVNGAIIGWKESGGFAGTYSPNAAFVQIPYLLQANTAYAIGLKWKANKADSGTIWAGAGPIVADYSPTRLTVQLDGCS